MRTTKTLSNDIMHPEVLIETYGPSLAEEQQIITDSYFELADDVD